MWPMGIASPERIGLAPSQEASRLGPPRPLLASF